MIKTMDYVTIVSRKAAKEVGLSTGDEMMVIGERSVPHDPQDPYTKRTYFLAVKLENNLPCIPEEGNEHQAYLLDPRSLEKVSEEKAKEYVLALQNHYGEGPTVQ